MTAPTPDTSPKMIEATVYDLHYQASNHETGDDAEWTHAVANLLAAVTVERDQARQMLADAPHTDICYYRQRQGDGCNCWKEEA